MTVFPSPAPQPATRWLSDKFRSALHAAYDEADLWVAERRLNQLCKRSRPLLTFLIGLNRCKSENLIRVTDLAVGKLVFHLFGTLGHFERRLMAKCITNNIMTHVGVGQVA